MTADYADRLNPMLVKELRQSLRTAGFVGLFLAAPLVMALILGFQVIDLAKNSGSARAFDSTFWMITGAMLLLVMPLKGMNAVEEEKKLGTLDLIQITQLSSRRIVFGKWICIVSQSLLFVVGVLPYLVLRYFLGEMDVVQAMAGLVGLVLFSTLLTAGAVMCSTLGKAVRVMPLLLIVFGFSSLMSYLFSGVGSTVGSFLFLSSLSGTAGMLIMWALLTGFALEVAASRIAPVGDNHTTGLRLYGLVSAAYACLHVWMSPSHGVPWGLGVIWFWMIPHALTEATSLFPSTYRPFVKRGLWARIAGRVLYPGWATGLVFVLLMVGILIGAKLMGAMLLLREMRGTSLSGGALMTWRGALLLFGGIASPLVIVLFTHSPTRVKIGYWLVLGLQCFWVAFCTLMTASRNSAILDLCPTLSPFGTAHWVVTGGDTSSVMWGHACRITLPMVIVLLLLLAWRARLPFRTITAMEAKAQS